MPERQSKDILSDLITQAQGTCIKYWRVCIIICWLGPSTGVDLWHLTQLKVARATFESTAWRGILNNEYQQEPSTTSPMCRGSFSFGFHI